MTTARLTASQYSALEINVLDPAMDECELAAVIRPLVRGKQFVMPAAGDCDEARSALIEMANAADSIVETSTDADERRAARSDRTAFTHLATLVSRSQATR